MLGASALGKVDAYYGSDPYHSQLTVIESWHLIFPRYLCSTPVFVHLSLAPCTLHFGASKCIGWPFSARIHLPTVRNFGSKFTLLPQLFFGNYGLKATTEITSLGPDLCDMPIVRIR